MNGIGRAGPLGTMPRPVVEERGTEREHWIALALAPGIGPATFWQLIARYGTAAAVWQAGPEGTFVP